MQASKTMPVILVVEDYADSRAMLKLLLEDLNHRVLTAANGKQALGIAANNRIDLILTDFGLPDMSGLGLVYRLRKLNHLQNVPIIMLTAFDGDEYRRLASQAGCSGFLTKPTDFDALERMIERALRISDVEGSSTAAEATRRFSELMSVGSEATRT